VVDRFGALGTAYCETDVVRTDLETTITDLMSGQFGDPVRVVAFNTLEHWARDVSRDIAFEIQSRFDIDGHDVPEALEDFVDSYVGPDRQPGLRLA
jgi:RNase P/RNase MRP subunit POP5